jgi:excinuclease UvrABC nuclease subunit
VSRVSYAEQVQRLLAFLNGEATTFREELVEKRDCFTADLQYEGAARLQQDIELFDHILHVHQRFHWIVTRANAFLLLPSRQAGAAQAYLVLNGRLIDNRTVSEPYDLEHFTALAQEQFERDRDVPLHPQEIDASVILAAWLRDPGHSQSAVFSIKDASTLRTQLDEIEIALQDLQRVEPV